MASGTAPLDLQPLRAKVFSTTEAQFVKIAMAPHEVMHRDQGSKTFTFVDERAEAKSEKHAPLLAADKVSNLLTFDDWKSLCDNHTKKLAERESEREKAANAMGLNTSGCATLGQGLQTSASTIVDEDDEPPPMFVDASTRGRGGGSRGPGAANRGTTPTRPVATPARPLRPGSAPPSSARPSGIKSSPDAAVSSQVETPEDAASGKANSRARKNGKVDINEYKLDVQEIFAADNGLDDRVMKPAYPSATHWNTCLVQNACFFTQGQSLS